MSRIISQNRRDSLNTTPTRPSHSRSSRVGSDATVGRRASRSRDFQEDGDRLQRFDEEDDGDDEISHFDRGEELVRQRMRARQRERQAAAAASMEGSLPPPSDDETEPRLYRASGASGRTSVHRRASIPPPRTPSHVDHTAASDIDDTLDPDLDPQIDEFADTSHADDEVDDENVEYTLKDRQDAINIEHPFGLPIWKPALYKKSRTVTRNAESALHAIPSAAAERHLLPSNLLWTILAGWWLSLMCFFLAVFVNLLPMGGDKYAGVIWGLGDYLFWPFGKYVEVEVDPRSKERRAIYTADASRRQESQATSGTQSDYPSTQSDHHASSTENSVASSQATIKGAPRGYGSLEEGHPSTEQERVQEELEIYGYVLDDAGNDVSKSERLLGTIAYGVAFWLVIFPSLGLVCLICWAIVFPIPMAKLSWVLLKNLASKPLAMRFRHAPGMEAASHATNPSAPLLTSRRSFLHQLKPGDFAPRPNQHTADGKLLRRSKILVCTYRSTGLQYYKYTVGGVNILFINTLPFVFFTIFDFFFVEPYVHRHHIKTGLLPFISSQSTMFVFALGSVIPLSYFIGMAVASISAQSSIGMGAVINATFGSIIEIILYGIALTQDKARLVEGSIIGSILAGVLLMPGVSMCSGAMRRKEQRFNARSAGVTSTMLIMAIIGILTPTLFYQIYGTFQLTCKGCPTETLPDDTWRCKRCYYEHVPPATDPFYQTNVKGLMYTCTVVLVLSYGVGLWFSLRTHASQIWQTPMPQERHTAAMHDRHASIAEGPTAIEMEAALASTTEHGGHDAPSWTRSTSLIVLLSCTVLYATIAEILVDAVDAVLDGSGLDIKFLGVTLFALVPNATEFMNAMSFAINGNIALSMEIGSAYALQVCLIQIPAMVAFSALYQAHSSHDTDVNSTFTLIFPRWDVIAIIFAIFLLTYTYIESRSNYFRGTLCILSYVVLISGFVFAPTSGDPEDPVEDNPHSLLQSITMAAGDAWSTRIQAAATSFFAR